MKQMSTFFQTCVFLTLSLFVISMSISFVAGLGVFPTGVETGFEPGSTTNQTFTNLTNITRDVEGGTMKGGIDVLFTAVLVGGIGTVVLVALTRSPTIIGVWIFSVVFWTAYVNMNLVLDVGSYVPVGFLAIGHGAMAFIFAGAIAGMLSSSG